MNIYICVCTVYIYMCMYCIYIYMMKHCTLWRSPHLYMQFFVLPSFSNKSLLFVCLFEQNVLCFDGIDANFIWFQPSVKTFLFIIIKFIRIWLHYRLVNARSKFDILSVKNISIGLNILWYHLWNLAMVWGQ